MTRLAALFARLGPDPRADGALLHSFLLDRDEAAFAELVRRHGPTVWGVCRRTLPAPADAEDAFQATFLVLLRRARGFDPDRCVGPWLYRVAVLTSRGLRRKNARRRTVPLPELPARPEPPAVDVDALLMRLPERERAAVVLCHLHGLTQRQAADRLGVPEGTLSARLSRGLAKLRQTMPAGLAVAVPATVAEAAVTVATAGRVSGPEVGPLVSEVLRMFWLKKLATAGLAVAAAVGVGTWLWSAGRPVAAQAPPEPRKQAVTPTTQARGLPTLRPGGKPPVLEPQMTARTPVAIIRAGAPYTYRSDSGKPLSAVTVNTRPYLEARVDPDDPTRVLLTGLKLGVANLLLTATDGSREGLTVAIGDPPNANVVLAVGESIDLAPLNGKSARSVELGQNVPKTADLGMEIIGKAARLVAKSKGSAVVQVTDESGLVWLFGVRVLEPAGKP